MSLDSLKQNIEHSKEIIREMYIFTNQLNSINDLEISSRAVINTKEKKLLIESIEALRIQLRILNNSMPDLINNIGFFKRLTGDEKAPETSKVEKTNLIQVKFQPGPDTSKISLTISEKDRNEFLENLSKSNLSINQLKNKFSIEKPVANFGKPNAYAKFANKLFRGFSNKLIVKGYLNNLNMNLRKMNSQFVVGTYTSMIILTMFISAIASLFLVVLLLFYNMSLTFPFLIPHTGSLLLRFAQVFWLIFAVPILTGVLMYFYPKSEGKSIGARINQELPFVTIHMSAVATSGIEPVSIFKIILRSEEYKYTNREFRKLMNLINFHGYDLVRALRQTAKTSPSSKLGELLNGMATAMTSGGDLHNFLDSHSDTLLFDYKLERERYTKTSETFMDIYISIVIAAPMILLILFVVMGGSGLMFAGLSTNIMSFLIILAIVVLNIGFLIFLKLKQPVF
jgi:Flp pilus assembly protein TadB